MQSATAAAPSPASPSGLTRDNYTSSEMYKGLPLGNPLCVKRLGSLDIYSVRRIFRGRRPTGTAAAGVGNVLCKILSVGFFGLQGGCLCESPEVPPDSIARMRALQRAKTHNPRKNERTSLFGSFWAEQKEQIDSISEFKENKECKEKRSILGVCELLKGEQRRNLPLQNPFLLFCGGNLVPTRGEKPQFTRRK